MKCCLEFRCLIVICFIRFRVWFWWQLLLSISVVILLVIDVSSLLCCLMVSFLVCIILLSRILMLILWLEVFILVELLMKLVLSSMLVWVVLMWFSWVMFRLLFLFIILQCSLLLLMCSVLLVWLLILLCCLLVVLMQVLMLLFYSRFIGVLRMVFIRLLGDSVLMFLFRFSILCICGVILIDFSVCGKMLLFLLISLVLQLVQLECGMVNMCLCLMNDVVVFGFGFRKMWW